MLFIVEATIAILMIFLITVLIFTYFSPQRRTEILNYKIYAYDGLIALEKKGNLRYYAINNDTISIKRELNPFIPDNIEFEVVLFNETGNVTEIPSEINTKKNVVSVSYLIAGNFDEYKPREIRVMLWGFSLF